LLPAHPSPQCRKIRNCSGAVKVVKQIDVSFVTVSLPPLQLIQFPRIMLFWPLPVSTAWASSHPWQLALLVTPQSTWWQKDEFASAIDEAKLLSSLSHPNVISFDQAFVDDDMLHIVM
jgi:serine/threonine protein kinase